MTKRSDEPTPTPHGSERDGQAPSPHVASSLDRSTDVPRSRRRLPVRVIALAVIVMSIGAMAAADRLVHRPVLQLNTPSNSLIGPVATDPSTGLSTWFCAGGSLLGENDDLVVTLANPTDSPAKGTVTFYGDSGERQAVEVDVPAKSQVSNSARAAVIAKHVAALIELDHGGVAVDHRIEHNGLNSVAPCSSSSGTNWYFADGKTELGSSAELSLFNPFGEDAIVDLSFATDQGPAQPAALQGFVVARNSVATIDVGSYVRRRSVVSTSVVARVGRLVAEQVQRHDVKPLRMALVVGAPSLGAAWYFPNGRTTGRLEERYVLYNPTDKDVTAQVDFVIDGAESEPFDLDVPRLSQTELITSDESRIPVDVAYSVVVATDAPSIVVSRTLIARSTLRSGMAITLGARRISGRWLIADATATTTRDDRLAFLNPTDTDAAVTVSIVTSGTITPITGLERVLLASGGRLGVRIGDYAEVGPGSALLVQTEGAPIVVERTASSVSSDGGRPDQPILSTVDANVTLPTPDADFGVDEGDSGDTSLGFGVRSARTLQEVLSAGGGRPLSFAVDVVRVQSTTASPAVVEVSRPNARTSTSVSTRSSTSSSTGSSTGAPTGSSLPASSRVSTSLSSTVSNSSATRVATSPTTSPATRVATSPTTSPTTRVATSPTTSPRTRVATSPTTSPTTRVATSPTTSSKTPVTTLAATTDSAPTDSTATDSTATDSTATDSTPIRGPAVVVPRPTKASGSTSSSMAIPLDPG